MVTALHDYRVLQAKAMTDPNGNRSEAAFDALGMVVATAVRGNPARISAICSKTSMPTRLLATCKASSPIRKGRLPHCLVKRRRASFMISTGSGVAINRLLPVALARETHFFDPGGSQTKIQISFSYSDGFGREIQKKIQAEPGDAPQREVNVPLPTGDIRPGSSPLMSTANQSRPTWRNVGRHRSHIFNNKGKPVRQYEPFFSATHLYEEEPEMTDTGVSPVLFYDPARARSRHAAPQPHLGKGRLRSMAAGDLRRQRHRPEC